MRRIGGAETARYVLVDGNNMLHRAAYAFVESRLEKGEPLLCSPSGYPTGVVYGSMMMLTSWLRSIPSATKVCLFLDGWPKRRKEIDPSYKANRLDEADGRAVKFPIRLRDGYAAESETEVLVHVLGLLGCDVVHHPEEEADDLIASFVRSRPGAVHVVVSDDKDFFQLLTDPRVAVFRPGSPPDSRFFDADASEAYWGQLLGGKHPKVPASYVRMFKSLCGDSSDGIRGVERLRKKVAVPLCGSPDVDALFATGLPGFSKAEREKAVSMKERIRLNFSLVGLDSGLDVDAWLKPGSPDFATAGDILREDLGMAVGPGAKVDLTPFRLGQPDPVPVPLEDWLADL